VIRYPLHSALLLLWFAGMIVTAIYDDVIYPMDDGLVSIGMVLLFVATLTSLVVRARRDEQRRKNAARLPQPAPPSR